MIRPARRRATGFTAAIAIVAALLSPLVAVSAANAADVVGVTNGTDSTHWRDASVSDALTVGVLYQQSVQAPPGHENYTSLAAYLLPDGLQAFLVPDTGIVSITGVPTTAGGDKSIWLNFEGADITRFSIRFDGLVVSPAPVVPPKTATTTSLTALDFQHYGNVTATAQVSSNTSGGSVQFRLGTTNIGTGVTVDATGQAVFAGTVPTSLIGTTNTLFATFSGDATYANSFGRVNDVYIYGDRVITGLVNQNGVPVASTTVQLLTTDGVATAYSAIAGTSGFTITLAAPTTIAEASAQYVLYVPEFGLYFTAGGPSATTLAGATVLDQSNWGDVKVITDTVNPTWTDEALAQPRLGQGYSDRVTAATTGTPATIAYTLSGDPLPAWLTFADGAFTSANPTDQDAHTFTVTATSSYGSIAKPFTLQAGDAAVPPTFTDTTIGALTVGTPLTDAIAATGDATIAYSSTPLPAGLLLNSSTGALTGTPTAAGDYVVTFTASNGTDPDDTFVWEPTIAAAPDLELVLDFAPGATLSVAETQFGASGLQVGSTYTLYLNSTPRLLYTGSVDASGSFLHTITLPADTPVGSHELVLTGIAPDGTVLTAHAWFSLLANGQIGAISYTGAIPLSVTAAALLAFTGSDPLLPIGLASALMLAGFVLIVRRRSQQA